MECTEARSNSRVPDSGATTKRKREKSVATPTHEPSRVRNTQVAAVVDVGDLATADNSATTDVWVTTETDMEDLVATIKVAVRDALDYHMESPSFVQTLELVAVEAFEELVADASRTPPLMEAQTERARQRTKRRSVAFWRSH